MSDSGKALAAVTVAAMVAVSLPSRAQTEGGFGEDLLSPEERSALELKRRREAGPVLACTPASLKTGLERGKTVTVRLTVLNKGGRTLRWSVRSAPAWLRADVRGGDLGFEEKRVLVLVADAKDLPAGVARGEFVLEAPGAAGSPFTVAVRLDVQPDARPGEGPGTPASIGDAETGVRETDTGTGTAEPAVSTRTGFGVRLGYIAPGGGDTEDFSGGATYGFYYRPGDAGGRLGFELGFDLASSDSESAQAEASFVMVSAAALYRLNGGMNGGMNGGKSFYLLGGGRLVSEKVADATFGSDEGAVGGMLDLGAGTVLAQGKVDVRATYSLLLGSENVPGAASFLVGYSF